MTDLLRLFSIIGYMEERGVIKSEDCVEAELVYEGPSGPGRQREYSGRTAPPPEGIFARFKRFIATATGLLALLCFVSGALLTSTVIVAIIGIPLMLAGAALFALLFKLLAGSGSFAVFRKFP